MAAAPPVATDRVASLKAAIETGRYAIDPARLADAMIASETIGR
jgi:flagellar biosynthesis anti-sigma factor FlgM